MSWRSNPGYCPDEAKGKRVKVRLRNGMTAGEKPLTPTSPPGWPADGEKAGRGRPMRWSLENHPFDVIEWDDV